VRREVGLGRLGLGGLLGLSVDRALVLLLLLGGGVCLGLLGGRGLLLCRCRRGLLGRLALYSLGLLGSGGLFRRLGCGRGIIVIPVNLILGSGYLNGGLLVLVCQAGCASVTAKMRAWSAGARVTASLGWFAEARREEMEN
jgi:hypothetical protein